MRNKKMSTGMNMNKQAGFTLIELVVVIVILGILAATAAPKFIDLTIEAKNSIVEGTRGALNSAADMAHAKALASSQAGDTGSISVDSVSISLQHGWPDYDQIVNLITTEDISATVISASSSVEFTHSDGGSCTATYSMAGITASNRPAISSDCP